MKKLYKNLVIIGVAIAMIAVVLLLYFVFGKKAPASLLSVQVENGDITQTVNLTGQVKASQGVDLAFEASGKVVANYVKAGDKVYAGQPLAAIDSSLLNAQLQQAEAQLDALNINIVQDKANASIESSYANSLNAAQKSVITAKDILLSISDIQSAHFKNFNMQTETLAEKKFQAVVSLLGSTNDFIFSQPGSLKWNSQTLSPLNEGAVGLVQKTITEQADIESMLPAVKSALQDLSDFINEIPIDITLSSTERSAISLAKTSVNAEIITTSANIQAINTAKVNNNATLTTTDAQIKAAQANINAIKAQMSKTVLRALFDGQVDKDNVVVGAIVSSGSQLITISNNSLEISTNIPEINMAEVKVGNDAEVTLDAFGNNETFSATIISVDSATSVVNGIPVYGAKLKFKDFDDRIKTGMTANITVISGSHSNTLIVPKSAVIQQNGRYFVIVDNGNSKKETREVIIGLNDGKNVEIISGLELGEKIFSY